MLGDVTQTGSHMRKHNLADAQCMTNCNPDKDSAAQHSLISQAGDRSSYSALCWCAKSRASRQPALTALLHLQLHRCLDRRQLLLCIPVLLLRKLSLEVMRRGLSSCI